MFARVIGGSMSDSPRFGRRNTLALSSIVLGVGSVIMGLVQDFTWFVAGNTLLGFGVGLYWPAGEAMIADITTEKNRRDAFALNRFADYGGLGIGVVLAGLIVQISGAFRLLFFIDAASYFILTAVIYFGISETKHSGHAVSLLKSWGEALRNPSLQLYASANILMTAYICQISSSMPLYFTDQVKVAPGQTLTPWLLSMLFAIHVVVVALSQMPIAKAMNNMSPSKSLVVSCVIWFIGFALVGLCGFFHSYQFLTAAAALVVMSIATVAYGPPSSALIADLAPPESLAIYFSINSLCWAVGGMIGPPLVLAAMDHFPKHTPYIWIVVAATTLLPAAIFQHLSAKGESR
jgi:MFS family permease